MDEDKLVAYARYAADARERAKQAPNLEIAQFYTWIATQWEMLAGEHVKVLELLRTLKDDSGARGSEGFNPEA